MTADARAILDRLLEALAPVAASAERHTNHVTMEASNPDWVTLSEAMEAAQEWLRETQSTPPPTPPRGS